MNMKAAVVLALGVSAAPLATAHTLLSKLYIDEVSQGDGTCLRMPEDGSKTTSPVDGLESDDMACGTMHFLLYLQPFRRSANYLC